MTPALGRAVRQAGAAVLGLVVAVVVVLLTGSPATAHASEVSMSPAPGSTLSTAPTEVRLTFDENIRAPSKIVVTGPSGRVDRGPTEVVDNTVKVTVAVRPRPSDVGSYRVAYRVVSADGHVVSAEASFRYAPPGVQAAPSRSGSEASSSASDGTPRTWWWAAGIAVVVVVAAGLLLPGRRRASGGRR